MQKKKIPGVITVRVMVMILQGSVSTPTVSFGNRESCPGSPTQKGMKEHRAKLNPVASIPGLKQQKVKAAVWNLCATCEGEGGGKGSSWSAGVMRKKHLISLQRLQGRNREPEPLQSPPGHSGKSRQYLGEGKSPGYWGAKTFHKGPRRPRSAGFP